MTVHISRIILLTKLLHISKSMSLNSERPTNAWAPSKSKSWENIPLNPKTIRKIWRQAGCSSRRRPKKHITKNNLREVKKRFALFEKMVASFGRVPVDKIHDNLAAFLKSRFAFDYKFIEKAGFLAADFQVKDTAFFDGNIAINGERPGRIPGGNHSTVDFLRRFLRRNIEL